MAKTDDEHNHALTEPSICPPWLLPAYAHIMRRHQQGRLPHALLLSGASELGKRWFAESVVRTLACVNPVHDLVVEGDEVPRACGECASCAQLQVGSYSDFQRLQPGGKSNTVRIDAIRELVSWLQLAAGAGRLRVAMIVSADTLNRAAANALLKTLEEPAANSVCFLLVERSAKLPATILSRCQKLPLAVSDQAATVAWLRPQLPDDLDPAEALSEAGNAPLRAVRQAGNEWRSELELIDNAWWNLLLHRQSVGRIVETVSHVPASRCLARFITLVASAVHHQCGTGQFSSLKALTSEQLAATQRLTSEQWFTIHDQLLHLYRIDNTSFKTQAVLEGFLADTRLKINR